MSSHVVTAIFRTGEEQRPIHFLMLNNHLGDDRLVKLDEDIKSVLRHGKSKEECTDENNPSWISHGEYAYSGFFVRDLTFEEYEVMSRFLMIGEF